MGGPRLVGINHVALEVDDVERALAFWRKVFGDVEVEHEPGAAFIGLGDQFVALMGPDAPVEDRERHFGLVVDDKEAVRRRLQQLGIPVSSGRGLDFRDPSGNLIQVVDYRDVQFTKTDGVLAAMGFDGLEKSESALVELRAKGVSV